MIESLLQYFTNSSTFRSLQYASWSRSLSIAAILVLLIILITFTITELLRWTAKLKGIPGPRGLPVVGNMHQIYPDPAERFRIWSQQYGPVYQIMLGKMPVVIFNSMQPVKDVFISQGGALVDRPEFHTFHGVLSTKAASIGNTPW